MISAKQARDLMPETKAAVDKAMRHAMDCIERHARLGESQCDATFGDAAVIAPLVDELGKLGYGCTRISGGMNRTLRISW